MGKLAFIDPIRQGLRDDIVRLESLAKVKRREVQGAQHRNYLNAKKYLKRLDIIKKIHNSQKPKFQIYFRSLQLL